MLDMELSIRDVDGRAVVALRGEPKLADTPGVKSHLVAAVAACGPSVIIDMAGLDGIGDGALPLAAPQRPVRQVLERPGRGLISRFNRRPRISAGPGRQLTARSTECRCPGAGAAPHRCGLRASKLTAARWDHDQRGGDTSFRACCWLGVACSVPALRPAA